MASICLSVCSTSKPLAVPTAAAASSSTSSSSPSCCVFRCPAVSMCVFSRSRFILLNAGNRMNRSRRITHVVRMAPDEEKLTRRNPLDFPLEWERPKPGRRPDIFPQFSLMKTPIPPPLPFDPPEEDEEEEEKKKEEEEEDPDKEEETEKPEKDQ